MSTKQFYPSRFMTLPFPLPTETGTYFDQPQNQSFGQKRNKSRPKGSAVGITGIVAEKRNFEKFVISMLFLPPLPTDEKSLALNQRTYFVGGLTFRRKGKAGLSIVWHQYNALYTCKRSLHHHHSCGVNIKLHSCNISFRNKDQFTGKTLNLVRNTDKTMVKSPLLRQISRSTKFTKGSRTGQTSISKRIKRILPHLFSEDGRPLPTVTVEKQLLDLMQMWAMEEAVDLLKESVEGGVDPDRTVILNLLQQLANLGEVECLLELHDFLKDRGLSTNLKFYHCLRDAYFNSGRVEDGILMLRVIYHGSRDFDDTDLLFTLLATMTARHFEHMLPVVESYVTDLEESDPPVTSARASLWRCLVLAEKLEKADILLEEYPEVKKMVPAQITKLVQSQLEVNYDRDVVLTWLMNSPYVKPGLSASLFDMLIQHKITQGQWNEGLKYLSVAMSEGRKIHSKTVEIFLTKFLNHLPQNQIEKLSSWATELRSLSEDETNG